MKVVAFYGSPRKEGNTYHAVKLVTDQLKKEGIETEIVQVGNKTVKGCLACYKCFGNKNEECTQSKDPVNEWIQKMKAADGIIIASPVHYSGIGGTMKAFLDRAFFVAGANDSMLRHKVGAAVAAVRRSGGLPTFNQLNHFLMYSEMMIPTSNYWNVIHGAAPGEVHKDEEGIQIMEVLGRNMSYLLKLIENGKGAVQPPEPTKKITTNFVR